MRIFGTILPYAGLVIGPCDPAGNPAMDDEEADAAQHETKAVLLAWFDRCVMFPIGEVCPRAIDPRNPRQWLAGDL